MRGGDAGGERGISRGLFVYCCGFAGFFGQAFEEFDGHYSTFGREAVEVGAVIVGDEGVAQGLEGAGGGFGDALEEFAKRCPVDAVTEFVNSLVQAEERGNPVAEVLSIQATVSRTRRSVRAEEMAAKAGVKLVGPLMLVFFCVMGLLLGPALMKISSDL